MRFIHSAGVTVTFKLLALACGLGVSILISRTLGPAGRGLYGVLMTVIVLSVSFGLFGFSASNTYFIAKDANLGRRIGIQSVLIGLLGALVCWCVLYLVTNSNMNILPGLHGTLFWATSILIPLFLWGNLFAAAYLGNGRVIEFNLFETGQRAIFLLLASIIILLLKLDLSLYIILVCVAMGLMVVGYAVRYFRCASGPAICTFGLLGASLVYGVRLYIATLFSLAAIRSGIFFVNYYRGNADAGIFAVAQQISELLLVMPSVIGTVLFPRVAGGDSPDLTARVIRTTIALFLPLALMLAIGVKPLIAILFGPGFRPSSLAFLILLPGAFFLGLEVIIANHMAGRGYPWPAALVWIPILIINVAGHIILIPRYGINGAALSTTIAFTAVSIFMFLYYRRMTGQRMKEMFLPTRQDLTAILSSARSQSSQQTKIGSVYSNECKTVSGKDKAEVERVRP